MVSYVLVSRYFFFVPGTLGLGVAEHMPGSVGCETSKECPLWYFSEWNEESVSALLLFNVFPHLASIFSGHPFYSTYVYV